MATATATVEERLADLEERMLALERILRDVVFWVKTGQQGAEMRNGYADGH